MGIKDWDYGMIGKDSSIKHINWSKDNWMITKKLSV